MKEKVIVYLATRIPPPFDKKNPKIVPGLCNRIRGLFSVYTLSQFLNKPFKFAWHRSKPCDSLFQTIFRVPQNFTHIEGVDFTRPKDGTLKIFRTFDLPYNFYNDTIKNNYDLDWSTYYQSYLSNLRKLKPISNIHKKILNFATENNINERIGLHIRKTDNGVGNKNKRYRTNENWYFNMIDSEIDQNNKSKFFLATDNAESRLKIMERYGDRVISYTTHGDFNKQKLRQTTIENSVIDLYCLSMCKRLYGENGSSFSDVASELGNIEFIRSEWNV